MVSSTVNRSGMYVSPINPIIKETLSNFLSKELKYAEQINDYDSTFYYIEGVID